MMSDKKHAAPSPRVLRAGTLEQPLSQAPEEAINEVKNEQIATRPNVVPQAVLQYMNRSRLLSYAKDLESLMDANPDAPTPVQPVAPVSTDIFETGEMETTQPGDADRAVALHEDVEGVDQLWDMEPEEFEIIEEVGEFDVEMAVEPASREHRSFEGRSLSTSQQIRFEESTPDSAAPRRPESDARTMTSETMARVSSAARAIKAVDRVMGDEFRATAAGLSGCCFACMIDQEAACVVTRWTPPTQAPVEVPDALSQASIISSALRSAVLQCEQVINQQVSSIEALIQVMMVPDGLVVIADHLGARGLVGLFVLDHVLHLGLALRATSKLYQRLGMAHPGLSMNGRRRMS